MNDENYPLMQVPSNDNNNDDNENANTDDDESLIQKTSKDKLLSVNWATVFLVSEMLGASTLSLPKALQEVSFYSGILIYISVTVLSATFALFLSETYATVRRDLKESLNFIHIRDPYPQLTHFVLGRKSRLIVVGCIILSDFLGAAGLMLLPADMLVRSYGFRPIQSLNTIGNMRVWVIVMTVIIIPLTWNDRPKDNKFVGLLSIVSGVCGQILLFIMMIMAADVIKARPPGKYVYGEFSRYILAIGILLTTCDGFDIIPNLQEDMKDPSDYKKVIIRSYVLFTVISLPIMTAGYLLFHHNHILSENIVIELLLISKDLKNYTTYIIYKIISYTTLVSFVLHIKMATVLQLNPTFQYIEIMLPCKTGFNLKRCIIRSTITLLVALFVIAAPNLLPIISFNGSLLYVTLGLVFPGILYIRVFWQLNPCHKAFIITIIAAFIAYLSVNVYFNVQIIGKDIIKSVT